MLGGSPYQPVEFDFSVANDGPVRERVRLQPQALPFGMRVTVSPAGRTVEPGEVGLFRCRLEVDAQMVKPGCTSDRSFLIVARRDARVTEEPWGAVQYVIRPRLRTGIPIEAAWSYGPLQVTGEVQPHPLGNGIRLRVAVGGRPVEWHDVPLRGGLFEWQATPPPPDRPDGGARITAYYDGDRVYGSAVSREAVVRYVTLI